MSTQFMKVGPCTRCFGKGTCEEVDHERLRAVRVAAGVSLRRLARQLGYSAAYLSDIELGKRGCSVRILQAYKRLDLVVQRR